VRRVAAVALPAALVAALATSRQDESLAQEANGAQARPLQDGARREQYEQMVADKRGHYGPADGGGSARIVLQPDPPPVCGAPARYVLEYTAGELGVAVGGAIYFQVSPFWGWTTPVVANERDGEPGNTRVSCDAPGVELACETSGPQCLAIHVGGAKLPAGAKVTIEYGLANPADASDASTLARVDQYAEAEEAFYFWVDGDGDGTRRLVASDPHVRVAPGPAVDLVVTATSEVGVGGSFDVTLAFVDGVANAAGGVDATVELEGDGLELPAKVVFAKNRPSHARLTGHAVAAGVRFVNAHLFGGTVQSNPILVSETPRRVLWADLHGHSSLSDGTGTPEDFYAYARDVAALDVAALTDHDHWGMRKLDVEPAMWKRIRDATEAANEPGRFTTLLGFEWTNWLHGHRHVLYFGGEGDVLSSLDPATDTPEGLWRTLKERKAKALTIAHHPGGGPVTVDWNVAPDPDFEPVVEITSVHGTSEEPRGPRCIYGARAGHFVRDALAKGYRLGFVGSGDTHNGHPGLAHLAEPCGGLAAILAADDTRDAVLAALKARTCYATTGPRILVWFRLGSTRMGSSAKAPDDAERGPAYLALVVGAAPIAKLELVKNGAIAATAVGNGTVQCSLEWRDPQRRAGDVVYLRALQVDGHAAFASPIFTE
jgi:hypothetical protein